MCSPGELSLFFPKFTGIHDVGAGYEHRRGCQWGGTDVALMPLMLWLWNSLVRGSEARSLM